MAVKSNAFNPLMFGGNEIPPVGNSMPAVGVEQPRPAASPFPKPTEPPAPRPPDGRVRHAPQWNAYYNVPGASIPLDQQADTLTAEELGPRAVNWVRQVSRLPLSEKYEQSYEDANGDVWIWSHVHQKFRMRYNRSESMHYKEHLTLPDQPPWENARDANPTSGPLPRQRILNPPNLPDPGRPAQRSLLPAPTVSLPGRDIGSSLAHDSESGPLAGA